MPLQKLCLIFLDNISGSTRAMALCLKMQIKSCPLLFAPSIALLMTRNEKKYSYLLATD